MKFLEDKQYNIQRYCRIIYKDIDERCKNHSIWEGKG